MVDVDVTWQQNKKCIAKSAGSVTTEQMLPGQVEVYLQGKQKTVLVKKISVPVETLLTVYSSPLVPVACCHSCMEKGDVDEKSSTLEQGVC